MKRLFLITTLLGLLFPCMPAIQAQDDDMCTPEAVRASFAKTENIDAWVASYQSSDCPDNIKQGVRQLADAYMLMLTSTEGTTTTVQGVITQDMVWSGTVHVVGDIRVEEGVTLTIEPGTKVLVAANRDAQNLYEFDMEQGIQTTDDLEHGILAGEPNRDEGNHISIRVAGTLQAVGTPDQMITITSDSPTPGIYDWNGLVFQNGILSYAEVSYYRYLNVAAGTTVSHNVLGPSGECGVCLVSIEGSVVIEDNTIFNAGHELIFVSNSSPVIRYNHLGPGSAGIALVRGGAPQIVENTIQGCNTGIVFLSPTDDAIIKDNTFQDNQQDIFYEY
jgi:hypothetical protein